MEILSPSTAFKPTSHDRKLCQSVLDKISLWGKFNIGEFTLYPVSNVYDLLYDPQENGNHDATGSYIIDCFTRFTPYVFGVEDAVHDKYIDEVHKVDPSYIFGYDNLSHSRVPLTQQDNIENHTPGLVYDYALMKKYFGIEDDEEFKRVYEAETDSTIDILKNYPQLFVAKLKDNPHMTDRDYLRQNIRRKVTDLMIFLNNSCDQDPDEAWRDEIKAVDLTAAEIEFLLDVHFKVLDLNHPLKINDLATVENLTR